MRHAAYDGYIACGESYNFTSKSCPKGYTIGSLQSNLPVKKSSVIEFYLKRVALNTQSVLHIFEQQPAFQLFSPN